MRFRLDRGRQRAGRGGAVGQAADDRGVERGSVGEVIPAVVPAKAGTAVPYRLTAEYGSRPSFHSAGTTKADMTHRTTPPFRADHVGSLLRPAALKQARAQFAQG